MTTNRSMFFLTDEAGNPLDDIFNTAEMDEPYPSSVVLTQGQFGTAWQRYFSDGLWHSVTRPGEPHDWQWMITQRNLVLVYDAPERDADGQVAS